MGIGDEDVNLHTPAASQSSNERAGAWVGRSVGEARIEAFLVEAPGLLLFRGRDSERRRWLIQVTPVRADHPDHAILLGSISAETAELKHDPEVKVGQYGYSAENSALYWYMPWTGAAERLGQTRVNSSDGLISASTSLLDRLISRHGRDRLDPLLHANLIVPRTGGADLIGLPVTIPESWIGLDIEAPKLAPEERTTGEPRHSGDLWRLGEALRELSADVLAPPGFDTWIDRLTDPDLNHRIAHANAALFELENLAGAIAPDQETAVMGPNFAVIPPGKATLMDEELPEATFPDQQAHGTLADTHLNLSGVSEEAKPGDEAETLWFERGEVQKQKESSAAAIQPLGPKGTVVGVRLKDDALGSGVQASNPSDRTGDGRRAPPTRVFDDPATHPPSGAGSVPPEIQAAAKRAMGPQGSSNLGPGGTVANEPVPNYGPGGTIAGEVPLYQLYNPEVAEAPKQIAPPPGPEHVSNPPPPRRMALTIVALLLLAIAAGAIVQLLNPPKPVEQIVEVNTEVGRGNVSQLTVTPWNDVLLETVPPDAQVISERDGQSLGPSPVRLLVPEEVEVAVLVTAPGFEPVRLILPTRGRVTVHLTSTRKVLKCPVEVQAPGTKPVQVVGHAIKPSPSGRFRIPGAVVMRSTEGHGAWLVRCATFGGQRRHRFVSSDLHRDVQLRVRSPKGAGLALITRPPAAPTESVTQLGPTPVETNQAAGFVLVEARLDGKRGSTPTSVSRWVPAFQDTIIELPRPVGR